MNRKEIYASVEIADHEIRLIVGEFYDTRFNICLLYTSPSPRDAHESRMPSSA